jgi:hypothetical protein
VAPYGVGKVVPLFGLTPRVSVSERLGQMVSLVGALPMRLVAGHHMCRIEGYELGGVIVDEGLRGAVERHDLRGLVWEELP